VITLGRGFRLREKDDSIRPRIRSGGKHVKTFLRKALNNNQSEKRSDRGVLNGGLFEKKEIRIPCNYFPGM